MRSFAPPLLLNNAFFLRSRGLSSLGTQYTSRRRRHIAREIMMTTSSSSSSSTSMSTDTSSVLKIIPTPTPPIIIGGDYAGLHATFSSNTGELIPIPHHLVPQSMIEWGDIPDCFETLVSEDWLSNCCTDTNDNNNERKGGKRWSLSRTMLTVMPEVGCGLDNLEITKKVDNISSTTATKNDNSICRLQTWQVMSIIPNEQQQQQRDMTIIDRVIDDRMTVLELETIFQLDDTNSSQKNDSDGQIEKDDSISSLTGPHRVRVSLSLTFPEENEKKEEQHYCDDNDVNISKLIDVRIERRISNTDQSTKGEVWTGPAYNSGGLDARTVYSAIGKQIKNGDVFAIKRRRKSVAGDDMFYPWTVPTGHNLGGIWKQTILSPPPRPSSVFGDNTTTTCVEVLRSENEFMFGKSTPSIVTLRLPQNIMIRYGNGISVPVSNTLTEPERQTTCCWAIEVSHISTIIREGKSYLHRTVALRSFNNTTTRRVQKRFIEDEEESYVLGDIHCWVEEKEGSLYS